MSNDFTLSTNLTDLPVKLFKSLAASLENNDVWQILANEINDPVFQLSQDEIEKLRKLSEPGTQYLRCLGNRGQTVESFIKKLHQLAKIYGSIMDKPQLILHRKFCSVIWSRPEQIKVSIVGEGQQLKLECKASGFPIPKYEWRENDKVLTCGNTNTLLIIRCPCTARNVFNCRVYNYVDDNEPYTEFYKLSGKIHQSELISNIVDLSKYVTDSNSNCEQCNKNSVQRMYNKLINNSNEEEQKNDEHIVDEMTTMDLTTAVVAADKVALIISNRNYAPNMSNLLTPHCDAETLASLLQQLNYKTVTLGDLRLTEMKDVIKEYKKLLGDGVYAIFYFVGHGFEANGQCYLLPTDAPGVDYGPEHCLSMDWVLDAFSSFSPALNLVLLDICRKYIPSNLDKFAEYAEQYRKTAKVTRNTVYGYATSGGVGAYEVRGETNGVFMKYLKNRLIMENPIIDVLNRVFRDVEKDKRVRDVQIPELRSNLTKPRSLHDPLIYTGHTESYHHHTIQWRLLHELPNPTRVKFNKEQVLVTVWFDFCGHFTNKVYVFSSVTDIKEEDENDGPPSEHAQNFLAYLQFDNEIETSKPKIYSDELEGDSVCILLSNIQRLKGEVNCLIELKSRNDNNLISTSNVNLGHVLITRLYSK